MMTTILNLLLVLLGFGLIIVLHELGHFLAARWAGIRVLAFGVGFGPAVASYRKGLGWRKGSSEPELFSLREAALGERGDARESARATLSRASHTEYRFNMLPFGGYVKMLGQDDIHPAATSDAPDSYQSCPPWKRMIVISAGVAVNLISAAVLFIVVFMAGLKTEPAVIGMTDPGSPAALGVALNASAAGVTEPGLKPGDRVLEVDGRRPNSFNDLVLASSMAERDTPVRLVVERRGVEEPLRFAIVPAESRFTGFLELGMGPAFTAHVRDIADPESREKFAESLGHIGLKGVRPGMNLVRVGGNEKPTGPGDIDEAVRASGGAPVPLVFSLGDSDRVEVSIKPKPELQTDAVEGANHTRLTVSHLLGLAPVMSVHPDATDPPKQGLRPGDIFARVGDVEFPTIAQGIAAIRAAAGEPIAVEVLREDGKGGRTRVVVPNVRVSSKGQIGFAPGDTRDQSTLLGVPPPQVVSSGNRPMRPAAVGVIDTPGTTLLAVNETRVANFAEVRTALRAATADAFSNGVPGSVTLLLRLPGGDEQRREWSLTPDDIRTLHSLSWTSPVVDASGGIFEPREIRLRADGPIGAISMGVSETRRVILSTYVTFLRLYQGTVKVEHLSGPVGIVALGTSVADRGFVWLLFFLALISVNLAVVNFLPLPIVDGGQFLFILYEQVRGRPVPAGVQNAVTLAGLVLIGAVFLLVTYNDIHRWFIR